MKLRGVEKVTVRGVFSVRRVSIFQGGRALEDTMFYYLLLQLLSKD